ncbi:MAG: phosphotransferase [Myxococcota bacterium]|nr:phosphotransferase [Myxococcota bacterium]
MSPPGVVADPARVTAEWLSEALRQGGALPPDVAVTGFEAERVGTGQVGQNVRFRLALSRPAEGAPASVVGKFPSSDPVSRATGVAQGNYMKEVRFYQEVAPTVDIRTPRCWHAAWEPEHSDFVLLMEDLAPARQGDQIAGCSVDEAALALEELAKLHAPRWNDPSLASIEWLNRRSPEGARIVQALYTSVWEGFVRRYGDRLAPEALAAAERLGPRLERWLLRAEGPRAVTHGDYRLDNMLFGTPEGGPPLAVVDWQTPGHGPPLADVSYFLGAGLPVELRRRHEDALLREYHGHLRAGGVSGYDLERCREDYRRFAWSGVVMAVCASMIVGQSERGDAMFLAMAERHCAHALDVGAESFLD